MKSLRTAATLFLAAAFFATACASVESEPTSTTAARLTTTAATTAQETTTTLPPQAVQVFGDVPPDLAEPVAGVMSWRLDQRNPEPPMPDGMSAALLAMDLDLRETVEATYAMAELETGSVAIVRTAAGDVYATADEGAGWRIVGVSPAAGGGWFGNEPRLVLVLGSDARPGYIQERHRADSVHLLTARASDGDGTILGFPRDSYIPTPFGKLKLSSVMAGRGPDVITDVMREEFGAPIEGYVVTGFAGFEQLMSDLGNLPIDLPRAIPAQPWWPAFPAGEQTLSPQRVLEYARTRKGVPGGDFTRSFNHGVIMLAVLRLIQNNEVLAAPGFLKILERHTWTDLPPSALIQLAATAFLVEPDEIENAVLPGTVGQAGGGSVVFLDDEAGAIVADLVDDGVLNSAE